MVLFNETDTTSAYTLSLPDAHPISAVERWASRLPPRPGVAAHTSISWRARSQSRRRPASPCTPCSRLPTRSDEHKSELQSRRDLVCRLLLEKTKTLQHLESSDRSRP